MLELVRPLAVRVARTMMMERASSRAKPWATKLYWPPTPLTTWPFSRPSDTMAPSSVAIMAALMKRALTRALPLGGLLAVKLVDIGHRGHAELGELALRHLAQRPVERARADEECRMQHRALDLPAQDAGMVEIEKAFHEHLARPVKAGRERRLLDHRAGRGRAGIEPLEQIAKVGRCSVAQDQRLRDRIAQRPDAELQRPAIGHDAGDPQPGGVFGEIDRLARRREQRKIGLRAVEHHVERVGAEVALARHERQLAVDLPDEDEIGGLAAPLGQEIEDDVRIAAQAVAGGAVANPLGHQLPDHIDAALQHGAERMGVVGRDIALLRGRRR